jgi:hypothetical protein
MPMVSFLFSLGLYYLSGVQNNDTINRVRNQVNLLENEIKVLKIQSDDMKVTLSHEMKIDDLDFYLQEYWMMVPEGGWLIKLSDLN